MRVIKLLLDQGVVVICAGGGGIPILRREDGSTVGIEAVIDKDAASALLAQQLKADALLLLTDVDAIYRDFGKDNAAAISSLSVEEGVPSICRPVRWDPNWPLPPTLPNTEGSAALADWKMHWVFCREALAPEYRRGEPEVTGQRMRINASLARLSGRRLPGHVLHSKHEAYRVSFVTQWLRYSTRRGVTSASQI